MSGIADCRYRYPVSHKPDTTVYKFEELLESPPRRNVGVIYAQIITKCHTVHNKGNRNQSNRLLYMHTKKRRVVFKLDIIA